MAAVRAVASADGERRWSGWPTSALVAAALASVLVSVGATRAGAAELVSSSALPSHCVGGASYCETFTHGAKGWPTTNDRDYYEGWSTYLNGTYRMVQRKEGAASALAPVGTADISQDYSVQVDVDAVLGARTPPAGQFGIVCWQHPTSDGGSDSAFLLFVGQKSAGSVLWDDQDGSGHVVASQAVGNGVVKVKGVNHLTAQCIQGVDQQSQSAAAQLSLTVNGQKVVSTTYDKSVANYSWNVTSTGNGEKSGLGVLASGAGEDVFYKNFAITDRCQPGGDLPCATPKKAGPKS